MSALAHPMFFLSGSQQPSSPGDAKLRALDLMDFFFVAHPASGKKEGFERNRVMFFSPKHETINRQTDVTGFAEAVVNFTDNFVDPKEVRGEFPFRTTTTKKTEQVYILVEGGEFIIGTSLLRQQCVAAEYPVVPQAIRTVLTATYKMFRLFFGTFTEMKKNSPDDFKERLDYFFGRYLHTLKLNKMPVLDWLEGVSFLPLNNKVYLGIVTLMEELMEEFPQIDKVLVLYQDKLLYYTVGITDLPSLFHYLTQNLLPSSIETELEPTRLRCLPKIESLRCGHGRFLRGPQDLSLDRPLLNEDSLPTVHLHVQKGEEEQPVLLEYKMLAYRILNATVCMFAKEDVSIRTLRNIDGFLGTDMSKVASDIGEHVGIQNAQNNLDLIDFHYIYYNPSSLSLTSSFEAAYGVRTPTPPMEIIRFLCTHMRTLFAKDDQFGEVYAKSNSEWWIGLRKANSRLLCLLLPPSSTQLSLKDINIRVDDIIKSHFESIFLI